MLTAPFYRGEHRGRTQDRKPLARNRWWKLQLRASLAGSRACARLRAALSAVRCCRLEARAGSRAGRGRGGCPRGGQAGPLQPGGPGGEATLPSPPLPSPKHSPKRPAHPAGHSVSYAAQRGQAKAEAANRCTCPRGSCPSGLRRSSGSEEGTSLGGGWQPPVGFRVGTCDSCRAQARWCLHRYKGAGMQLIVYPTPVIIGHFCV